MVAPPKNGEQRGWAQTLRYTWILVGVVFLYVAATVALRWRENRQLEQEAARKASARQAESDRRAVEALGGASLKIIAFYAAPPEIRRGDRTQICYGVANAAAVSIEPPLEAVWPSYSRCVDAKPRKNTTYTLTATDAAGDTQTAQVAVRVR